MRPEQIAKAFFFKDREVGYFESKQLPTNPGQHRYMPYRGAGHYAFLGALASGEPQRCHYLADGEKRYFVVLRLIE